LVTMPRSATAGAMSSGKRQSGGTCCATSGGGVAGASANGAHAANAGMANASSATVMRSLAARRISKQNLLGMRGASPARESAAAQPLDGAGRECGRAERQRALVDVEVGPVMLARSLERGAQPEERARRVLEQHGEVLGAHPRFEIVDGVGAQRVRDRVLRERGHAVVIQHGRVAVAELDVR